MNPEELHHDLIVTIIPKGSAEKALRASREAGAEGGTVAVLATAGGQAFTRSVRSWAFPSNPRKRSCSPLCPIR